MERLRLKEKYSFSYDFSVRDSELDIQGIVNNSVYLVYLEHTRHEFLKSKGLDFAKLHDMAIDAVVHKIQIEYKNSLVSGDNFYVRLLVRQEDNLRIIFDQAIIKKNGELSALAEIEVLVLQNKKLVKIPNYIVNALFIT